MRDKFIISFYGGIVLFCLFYGVVAFAQPPGLLGTFLAIAVTNINAGSPNTTADITHRATTTEGVPLYTINPAEFSSTEMLDLCEQNVMPRAEYGAVESELDGIVSSIGGGQVDGCRVVVEPPEDEWLSTGLCWEGVSTVIDPGTTVAETYVDCLVRSDEWLQANQGTYPNLAETGISCTPGLNGLNGTSKGRYYFNTNGQPFSHIASWLSPSPEDCADLPPPPEEPPIEQPTDDEIMEQLAPLVNQNWWFTYNDNRVTNDNDTINDITIDINNDYSTHQSTWMTGQPLLPSNISTDRPSTSTVPPSESSSSLDCSSTPDILACQESEVEDVDLSDITIDVVEEVSVALEVVDFGETIAVDEEPGVFDDLVESASCPAPDSVPFLGETIEIDPQRICDTLDTFNPFVVAIFSWWSLTMLLSVKTREYS